MDELLALRLALLGILLVFIALVGLSMRSGLVTRSVAAPAPSRRNNGYAELTVISPAESGLSVGSGYELAGMMTIGRDPGNSIVIPDPSVSGQHAAISRKGNTWTIRDLGSTNGTLLDDRPVGGRDHRLRGGERITVGSVVLRFQR